MWMFTYVMEYVCDLDWKCLTAGKIMFTKDQSVILTHGRSSCVEMLLKNAWRKHQKRFSVIVTRQEEKPGDFITDDVYVGAGKREFVASYFVPAVV